MDIHFRKLAASKAIREYLKVFGAWTVYNNIYPTKTRTVKICTTRLRNEGKDFKQAEEAITNIADLFDLDVKFNYTRGNYYGGPAFIVKL